MKKTLLSCLALAALLFAGSLQSYALEKDAQGVYQINTIDDLYDFADIVNLGEETDACAVLNADLDMAGEEFTPIGNPNNLYTGTFDGQGHKIIDLTIDTSEEYVGFFGAIGGGAYIKNLFIAGEDAFIGGDRFCAGIAGGTKGKGVVVIENCGNEAWVYSTRENAAGILGVNMLSEADVTILNCYNTGQIQGSHECAAICGWIGDRGMLKNCWNTASVEGRDSGRPFCRYNGCEFEGNWDVQGIQEKIGTITDDDLAGMETGEFCFRVLNQTQSENVVWYQTLGTDEHPYPIAAHGTVYAVGELNCDGTSKGGETTYSNENNSSRDPHNFEHGACTNCDEWDADYMTADAEGFFTLASDADFYWFARLVNQKEKNHYSARLAADINYTHDVRLGDAFNFMGTLDGQFHTITFKFESDADKLAFIKNMENATVQNIYLKGEINSSTHFSAGVVSEAYGESLIKNVVADVNINSTYDGDGTHGGLVAVGHGDLTIENCAYIGELYCPYAHGSGGIMGWSGDGQRTKIKNCYVGGTLSMKTGADNIIIARNNPYIEDCWVSDVNEGKYNGNDFTTFYEAETMATGEFCYASLNKTETSNVSWYQTLGVDACPVPFATHGTVYVAGAQNCDGTPKGDSMGYSNDPAGNRDPHAFGADGFCEHCHAANPDFLHADADGFYAISNSNELEWFAVYTKTEETKTANAKLVADINYTGQEMFGKVRCNYGGVFDGQEHTITLNLNRGDEDNAALFEFVEGANIKNLVIDGEINTNARFAGGLVVQAYDNTVVENVIVKATITSDYDGDGTHGGIVAIGNGNARVENCAFVGVLEAPLSEGTGGIMGWAAGGDNNVIKNCYVAGELNLLEGTNNIDIARNNPYIVNCWASYDISYYNNATDGQYFDTTDEMTTGQLCYNLRGTWRQNLGEDAYPVPFASHKQVYAHGDVTCDGSTDALTYDNVEGSPNYLSHVFVDGECTGCHNAYQIGTADGIVDLAFDVMAGDKVDSYIELTADIDLADADFFAIGGRSDEGGNPFRGTFDGKGHKISNMVIDTPEVNNQGFFGCVTGGAIIRNLVIDASCSVNAHGYSAGLIGATQGNGQITIENCGNEADVTVAEANAAGILGVDDLGGVDVTMVNCYNTGAIKGGRESAAFAGWLSKRSSLTGCWNSGEVIGLDGKNTFARSSDGKAKYTNCYETIGTQVTAVTEEQVANGELTALLNNGAGYAAWYQNVGVDAHPMLNYNVLVDSIESVAATAVSGQAGIFNINGVKMNALQKGINIVRMTDGTVKKVLVK